MRLEKQIKQAAALVIGLGLAVIAVSTLSGCGKDTGNSGAPNGPIPQPGPQEDGSIVRGVAVYTVNSNQQNAISRLFKTFLMPTAWAASTASTVVTYNNASSVTFSINVASFVPGAIANNTLSLGSVSVSALNDNNLKVCNPGGNTKCTQALLRVYTTGTIAGFVNTSDSPQYGAPLYTSGQNPTTPLIIGSPGTQVASLTGIAANKHTVLLSDFPSPSYNVTSDFLNAGSGSYSMTYVVEYALAP